MRYPTAARRAFTMVEVLVTISIIVILVGLGLLAYSHIDRATIARATRADLQTAQGFLDEYNAGPGITQLGSGANQFDKSFVYQGGVFPAATPPVSGPNNTGPIGGTTSDPQTTVWTGNVSINGNQRTPTPNTPPQNGKPMTFAWDTAYIPSSGSSQHNAIYNTGEVMALLMRMQAISQAVAKMPPQKLLSFSDSTNGSAPMAFSTGGVPMPAPILLDGWGNPLIFVPAGGLITKVSGGANGFQYILVRTSGIIILDGTNGYSASKPPPLKDNDHPFWASAGPDGDFYGTDKTNGGDDNLYSFQQ